MHEQVVNRIIGTIVPMGNGAVGKTTLATLLAKSQVNPGEIRKTKNLEFEYTSESVKYNGDLYQVIHQYLVPPGQKESEGDLDSRSFEKVLQIYRDLIGIPQVILLTYDVTNVESFYDLEFWVNQARLLADSRTEIILVGTHLDSSNQYGLDGDLLANGIKFVEQSIQEQIPEWNGTCNHIEVSNQNSFNIAVLKRLISLSILHSRGIDCLNDSVISLPVQFEIPA
jgi:GTPase SAR1 family protein